MVITRVDKHRRSKNGVQMNENGQTDGVSKACLVLRRGHRFLWVVWSDQSELAVRAWGETVNEFKQNYMNYSEL